MRWRGDQRDARHGVAQLRDIRGDFVARQLAAFARLRTLRHFNLNDVGIDQIGWRHAEAARSDLLDARDFIGAVARRIFAAFAGVGAAAERVHRFGQRLMRLRAERADRHRRGVKTLKQLAGRLDVVDMDRFGARLQRQQIAQRRHWTLVHQLRIGLIVAVFAALYGALQGTHHVRVIGVILAAVHILQQAALVQRLALQPGAFRQIGEILLEVGEAGAADAADHALEAEARYIGMQAHRFEQFRAAIGGDGRDAHFGHDLVKAFVDAVTVVQHHGAIVFFDHVAVDHLRQRFIGQVRIDSGRAEAEQYGKVVRIARAGGLDDNVGVAAQVFLNQTRLHRADDHRRRNRQAIFADGAIGEHQQHGTVAHHTFGLVAQRVHRLFQRLRRRVEGAVERVGAIVLAFHGGQLIKVGPQQDRGLKADAVRLTFRFAEDVHFAADAGGQRHHMVFTQRIDRRVGHLRKLLAEIVINNTRAAGEYGKRRVVAHRADRFLAVLAQHANNSVELFAAVAELLLVSRQQRIVQLAAADLVVRQIFERHQTLNVFLHPLFIGMATLQIVIGFRRMEDAPDTGVDHHQLTGTDAAFLYHFVRLVIPDADFGGAGDQLVFGNHVARRTQAVTVKVTGGVAAVGHDDARRAVPRLHMHGVEVEEGAQFRIHIRVVLPCGRHQQAHRAHQVHAAVEEQLQHVVHRTGVGAGFIDERPGVLQIGDQRRIEFVGARARPLPVTGDGVDFAVVRHIAERLRQRPARYGIGREALMEQADSRFQTQVRQIEIEARQVGRHTQAFVDIDLVREATDIKCFIVGLFNALFRAAARHIKATLHIARTPAGRGVNKELLNARHRGEGDLSQYVLIDGHVAPADHREGFTDHFLFHNAAARLSLFFIMAQEQHAHGVIFRQAPAFFFRNDAEETVRFL